MFILKENFEKIEAMFNLIKVNLTQILLIYSCETSGGPKILTNRNEPNLTYTNLTYSNLTLTNLT